MIFCFLKRSFRHVLGAIIIAGVLSLALLQGSATADNSVHKSYVVNLDASRFGYLLQDDLQYGPEECGPSSAVNELVYLQNTYPEIYGDKIVGSTYDDWKASATTLGGFTYMDVGFLGTGETKFTESLIKLLKETVPDATYHITGQVLDDKSSWTEANRPEFIENRNPSPAFLYTSLMQNKAVGIAISAGHFLTVTGINWNDLNGNNVIDKSENATLSLIDPLDPENRPTVVDPSPSQAVAKTGKIFEQDNAVHLVYDQRYLEEHEVLKPLPIHFNKGKVMIDKNLESTIDFTIAIGA